MGNFKHNFSKQDLQNAGFGMYIHVCHINEALDGLGDFNIEG